MVASISISKRSPTLQSNFDENYSLVERKKDKCHSVLLNSFFNETKTVNLNAKLKTSPYTIINPNVIDTWVTLRPHRTPCGVHRN